MSAIIRGVQKVLQVSVSQAFNPVLTASLLWLLTKAPASVQAGTFGRFETLRNPESLTTVVRVLQGLLALGLLGTANEQLNKAALNGWRLKSEKKRWDLSQEIAVVTGGSSGIGKFIAKGLEKKGVTVAVLDIQPLPKGFKAYPNIKFFACDITDAAAVNEVADRIRATLGSPSILVNNAGIGKAHAIVDIPDDWLRKIFGVNLLSNFTTVKAFLPDMVAKNKGHIVTVASGASFVSAGGMVDYCTTKAGVLAFHEGLNAELKHHHKAPNVLTTSVHPHWVRTPLVGPFAKLLRQSGESLIEPQAVADAVVNQIANASGAQLFLPGSVRMATGLRGQSNWLQEWLRGLRSQEVLQCLK